MFSVSSSMTGRSSVASFSLSLSFLVCFIFPFHLTAQRVPLKGGESTFTARLINIEAASHETFQYNTTLRNNAVQNRVYELRAELPAGWTIAFRARGSQITSINIDGNKEQEVSIDIHPPRKVESGKYKIPILAIAEKDTLRLDLEAAVKGTYGIELTTSTGMLSDHVTEGSRKEIHLVLSNTGSLALENVSLSAQAPPKWTASFNPSTVAELAPGKTIDVVATVDVPDKTLAGDYVTTFKAQETHINADSTFRISVRTSLLSGWIGVVTILLAVGLVFYLIRKYGRR